MTWFNGTLGAGGGGAGSGVTPHAPTHSQGAGDEIVAQNLGSASAPSGYTLEADGAGGWNVIIPPTAPVTSVFTRTGDVVALPSDYDASQVDNDSSVSGAFVDDALDALDTDISNHIGDLTNPHQTDIDSLGSGTLAELNSIITDATLDDSSSPRTPTAHAPSHSDGGTDEITVHNLGSASIPSGQVLYADGVGGLFFDVIGTAPVDSVFGRTGTVVAVASDYDASQIDNDSSVSGVFVDDALNTLNTDISNHIADMNNPHNTDLGNLGSGTLAELNSIIVDANIDGSGDPRPPILHAPTHSDGGTDEITVHNLGSAAIPSGQVLYADGIGGLFFDTIAPAAPAAHASTHSDGGSDEITVHDLGSASIPSGQVLHSDGLGGLFFDAVPTAPVDSVFGRTGVVIAAASDYDASQIDNDSGVSGVFVSDALDTLDTDISNHIADMANPHNTNISNLGSGTLAQLNSLIVDATLDDSGDPRTPTAHATTHSDGGTDEITVQNLGSASAPSGEALISDGIGGLFFDAIPSAPVDSVFGRTGVVVAVASDYDASQIDNDSSVSGIFVDDALDVLNDNINNHIADMANPHGTDIGNLGAGTLAELNSIITDATLDDSGDPRTPTAHAASHSDGASDEITVQNLGSAAAPSGQVLTSDGAGGLFMQTLSSTAPVDSVFGRIGAVIAVASDYDASQIDNDSGVSGVFVSDALDTLDADISNHIADMANPHGTDLGNLGTGTLAELNSLVTDATLDDSGDPRTPTAHATTHSDGGTDEITVQNLGSASIPSGEVLIADGAGGLLFDTISNIASSGDYDTDDITNVSNFTGDSVTSVLNEIYGLIPIVNTVTTTDNTETTCCGIQNRWK
jgi:hypothetical protein